MKPKLILCLTFILIFYVAGYFFEVHQRLRNPFISWPIMKPLPMVADYRISVLKPLYEPVVRLNQKMFPQQWQCQPTPVEQYEFLLTNKSISGNP
jgi:hypothetical protein